MPSSASVRARYEDFEDFKKGLAMLKEARIRPYGAYGPVNLKEIEDLMPKRGSPVRIWATLGAIFGMVSFWYMCVASSLLYSIVVGGKPPVSNVPFVIVSYEGTILLGSLAAFIAVLVIARLKPHIPPSDYLPGFSGSEFGIELEFADDQRSRVIGLLRESGASGIDEL